MDVLLRTGDVPRAGAHRDVPHRYARALGGRGAGKTWARLYLTCSEAFALAVLLVASESWNRSVLDRMRVPEHYPAAGDDGFDIHLVEVEKRRRPVRLRYTTNNLVDTGPGTPGRLMGRAVEATELARQTLALLGTPTDRLLVSRRACTPGGLFCSGVPRTGSRRWASEVKLATGDRMPEQVSLRRLRRTVQVLVRKEPAQNTQRTHDSVYLLPDPATRAEAQQTVVAGLNDALDHARSIVAMRMVLGDDADELVELSDHPELAAASGPDGSTRRPRPARTFSTARSPPGPGSPAPFRSFGACAVRTRSRPGVTCRALSTCTERSTSCGPRCPKGCGTRTGASTSSGCTTCSPSTPPRPSRRPPPASSPAPTEGWSTGCSAGG